MERITEDRKHGDVVPDTFPGSVSIDWTNSDEGKILNASYRAYGNADNAEFYYFLTRILASVNPVQTGFKSHKGKLKISDMFTVSDEAFAILMLHNEYDTWVKFEENKVDPTVKKRKKRFCDADSGRREGWAIEGRLLFSRLCEEIEELRRNPATGSQFEALMLERIQEELGGDFLPQAPPVTIQTMQHKPYIPEALRLLGRGNDNCDHSVIGQATEDV